MRVTGSLLLSAMALTCCLSLEVVTDMEGNALPVQSNSFEEGSMHTHVSEFAERVAAMNTAELIVVVWATTVCDNCKKFQSLLEETIELVRQYPVSFFIVDPSNNTDPIATKYRTTYNIEYYPHITIFQNSMDVRHLNTNDVKSSTILSNLLVTLLTDNPESLDVTPTNSTTDNHSMILHVDISSYLDTIQSSPITVLVIVNGTSPEWHVSDESDDKSGQKQDGTEIIVIDAQSPECQALLYTHQGAARWKVRGGYDEMDMRTAGPLCWPVASDPSVSVPAPPPSSIPLFPQAWVFHWRDMSLVAPIDWALATTRLVSLETGGGYVPRLKVMPSDVDNLLSVLHSMDTTYTR